MIFVFLIPRQRSLWTCGVQWTGPVAFCLAGTLCIASSSPPYTPKRWFKQRGVGPFSRGHWHIFSLRGRTTAEKLKAFSNCIPFLKKKILYITCLSFVFFFWRYQCFTFWTVFKNVISILLLFFFIIILGIDHFHIFFQFQFRILGYDGVQQTFKDYFKFLKKDNRYLFLNEVM